MPTSVLGSVDMGLGALSAVAKVESRYSVFCEQLPKIASQIKIIQD